MPLQTPPVKSATVVLDTYHLDTLREASESQERVANLITKTTDRIEGFCR